MNLLRIWWADNRGKVIGTLVVLWVGALVNHFEVHRIVVPMVAVAASIVFDYLFSLIRKGHGVMTLSAVVTGLLIGLIFDETAGLAPLIAACILAAASKQFIGLGDHRHIFNPAAFGILASSFVFHRPVAWWAASWGILPVVIIAIGMTPVLFRLRRMWMPVLFLCIYFLIIRSIILTIDGTVFLFAFIMLPELITSPSGKFWKYVWGILVGILVAVQVMFLRLTLDPLLTALLAANIVSYIFLRL